jgi:diacylglycerol O-acyltransferase / wax synthase
MTGSLVTPQRLSAEDARILKLERGAIRGHTCKVLMLEPTEGRALPTVQALREHLAARLDAAPRLRQRVVATPLRIAGPVWLDDPQFDIAHHVTRVPTTGPVTRSELEGIVARLMAERLDHSRPLWQLHVVERLQDGSMALIWRLHHCLADGTTSVRFGAEILWSGNPDPPAPPPGSWQPDPGPGALALFVRGATDRARVSTRILERPLPRFGSWSTARGVLRRELSPGAARTPLAHSVGMARSVALASAPLEECKRAGKAIGETVTLNDVALGILAGGVGAWLQHEHGPTGAIRVKVPVSLHRSDEDAGIANRDSYFFVDLPVDEPDAAKRVLRISRETSERKLDRDAETLYRLGQHALVARWAMSPRVFTFNISNVRGPSTDVYVLGSRVRELYSLAEIAQRHALRVAVISASGSLFFGLCADPTAVKDLHVLADGLRRATAELLELPHL